MTDRLDHLLDPRSVAVVGLSADKTKHAGRVVQNLRKMAYGGPIYGVHPTLTEHPDADGMFNDIAELPDDVDVAVMAVPAAAVVESMRRAHPVGTAVVVAGGFAETGPDGARLQDALEAAAIESGTRLVGPNSGGIIVPGIGLGLSFLTCLDRPATEIRTGPVGLVTQSGGTGSYIHNLAAEKGSGLAASISTGNEVDITVSDAIALLAAHDEVQTIAVVLETVRDGRRFVEAVTEAHDLGKQVVALHIGRAARSSGMLTTHTGAMATDARAFDAVRRSLGIATASTPGELLEVAEIIARTRPVNGSRVGVVTHSGGIAILMSDLAAVTAVDLPDPDPVVRRQLEPYIDLGAIENPLDMGAIIGGPHRFGEVVDVMAEHHDVVLAVSSAHPPAHTEQRVDSLLALHPPNPVIHLWMAGDVAATGLARLRAAGAAVTEEPRAAIAAIDGLVRFAGRSLRARTGIPVPCAEPVTLSEHLSKLALAAHGIAIPEGGLATTREEAARIADDLGDRVALKLASPDLLHTSGIGGVTTNVRGGVEAANAFDDMIGAVTSAAPHVTIEGVRIERHTPGFEALVTAFDDERFGPMVGIGTGGAGAEAANDLRLALAPLDRNRANRVIARSRVLERAGEAHPSAIELAGILLRLGDLVASGEFAEIEINPIAWTGARWLALDAVVRQC